MRNAWHFQSQKAVLFVAFDNHCVAIFSDISFSQISCYPTVDYQGNAVLESEFGTMLEVASPQAAQLNLGPKNTPCAAFHGREMWQ